MQPTNNVFIQLLIIAGQEGGIEDQSGEFLMMGNVSVASPKRMLGILRHPDTPGTGQSVRFGRRLYDDGDESRLSDMDSIGSLPKVAGRESEDDTARHSVQNEISIASDVSLPLLNPSMMEGYSDLQDTSLLHEDDGHAQHQSPSIDIAISARSFDSDYQSDYKSAISPSSTRMDASAHSDWATPKSRMSSIEDEENNLEAFIVKSGHETSISDLSIPWSQQQTALLSSSSNAQILQRDASQLQDMSSVYFPGALGRNISMESPQKESEKNVPLIDPLPIESTSPFGEILDVSCNMDRVHTERTTMLLTRLQNAQEMYAQLQKEFESERIASQKARDELAFEKQKAKEKAEEHSQEMEHVRSLVAHLNEQSLRRKKEDSVLQTSIVNQPREQGKKVDAHLIDEEEENKQVNKVKNDTSGSIAHAELSEVDAVNTIKEIDNQEDDLQLRFAEMKQLLETSEAEKAQYEARIQDLDEMHYSFKVQLEEAEKDRDAMREEVNSLNQQMAAINEENGILQQESQNRDSLLTKEAQITPSETEKIAESSLMHKENHDTLRDTSQDISIIRTRLQEAKEAEQESRLETARLQEYADRLESDLDKQKEEILEMQQSYAALQQENENLLSSLAESDLAREKSAEKYIAKKDHDELLDLAEQMQARIDMIQKERTDERKRVTSLEKELSNRGITIANLEKLHERLEEENLNLGIALSSKQQELSLLKRLGTKPLSSQTPRSTIRNRLAVRDLVMQSRTPIALKKQDIEGENTAKALPLQDLTTNQTLKSVDDTQENELPLLQKGPSHLRATRRKTIDGRPLLEDRISQGSIKQPNGNDDRTISTSPASKAMPPPPMRTARKSQSSNRSSTFERNEVLDSSKTGSISNRVMKSSSAFGGGPRSSIAGSRYSTSSMSSSISAIRGPMDLSELTSSHN